MDAAQKIHPIRQGSQMRLFNNMIRMPNPHQNLSTIHKMKQPSRFVNSYNDETFIANRPKLFLFSCARVGSPRGTF